MPAKEKKGPGIVPSLLGLVVGAPLTASLGWIAYSNVFISHAMSLPPAVSGTRHTYNKRAGRLNYYVGGPQTDSPPLLLIHSINAAASSYEMRPMFEHYRCTRRVYSVDLPGFGFSDRLAREYTPRLYADAVLDMLDVITEDGWTGPVDAVALSLGCEFLARAASDRFERFRTLAFISPTGFYGNETFYGEPESTRANLTAYKIFTFPVWSRAFFDLLNTKPSQLYFLKKSFSSDDAVDPGLRAYDHLAAHQPGGRHAPYYFVSGMLFSADIDRIYDSLSMPVWFAYGSNDRFRKPNPDKTHARKNWTTHAFPTGGLPHFEQTGQFCAAYDAFLELHT